MEGPVGSGAAVVNTAPTDTLDLLPDFLLSEVTE